jgi:outer membrane protein insertion porin family
MKRLVILTTLFLSTLALAAQSAPKAADPAGPAGASDAPAAQAQGPAPAPAQAQEQAADWFWGKPINEVQWSGLNHADKRELDSTVKPYIGKAFTEELWMELQSKLYELDWFEKIDPSAIPVDETKARINIKFSVVEKPAIDSVRVVGNSGLKSGDILDQVTAKAGDIYNQSKAKVDELAVRRYYLEKGYPDATVSSGTSPGKSKNSVILSFRVSEGTQVAVREIRFAGNTAVSSSTLKGKMKLKESGFLRKGAFQESKLEEDKKAIVDYYKGRGFVDAAVDDVVRSYEKDPKTSKTWLILTISVKEGKQWTFDGVGFEGNTIFATDKLQSYISEKPGTILNYNKLQQDKSKIDDLYYESGYIFNTIALKETRNEEKQSISYLIKIVEEDRAHIESLTIKGNKKTKDYVLYREIPLEVGDVFSKAKIMEGLRNLYNLQYFSAVDPQMFPGSVENLMNLVVSVEEQSTASIQFGITLSGLGDPDAFPVSGMVKWDDKNFIGSGTDLSVEANGSPTAQTFSLGYNDRYMFGDRIAGGVSLSFGHKTLTTGQDGIYPYFDDGVPDPFTEPITGGYSLSSIPSAYRMPYNSWSIELGLSSGYSMRTPVGDLGFGGGVTFGVVKKTYDEDRYRPASEDLRDYAGEWRLGNKLVFKTYLNALDLSYNPSKGYYASERVTWAGLLPPPHESQQYVKSETKLEGFVTLFNIPVFSKWNLKWVLGAHTGFQSLMPKPGMDLQVSDDWLYIDGTFNARGWNDIYGFEGTRLWENWIELRMPILEQYFWLDGFIDAAALKTQAGLLNMNPEDDPSTPEVDTSRPNLADMDWNDVAMSMGFGIRFSIQQFPFRFYFAKRFVYDGSDIVWKTKSGFDIVISITQPL